MKKKIKSKRKPRTWNLWAIVDEGVVIGVASEPRKIKYVEFVRVRITEILLKRKAKGGA